MRTIILLVIFLSILVGYLVYVNTRRKKSSQPENTIIEAKTQAERNPKTYATKEEAEAARQNAIAKGECCGQHAVCERDTLINTQIKAEYYDDEELDRFIHREPSSYTDEEISEFEEVFSTLKEYDVNGWLKSLQIRGIALPDTIRDEAILILQERRFNQ